MKENLTDKKDYKYLVMIAAYAAIAVSVVLSVGKFIAWIVTSSLGVQASLIDSILDGIGSMINFFALKQALIPPDNEHRFGHGKAEALAGLGQSTFILASAIFLIFEAINRCVNPVEIKQSNLGSGILIIAIVLSVILLWVQKAVIRKTGSLAIEADSLHYQGDMYLNLSALVSLNLAAYFKIIWIDSVFAIITGFYIIYNAWKIFLNSLNVLMDRELEEQDRLKIIDIVTKHSGVLGIHDLRTRSASQQIFIQFHLELDGNQRLSDTHEITSNVKKGLIAVFPKADIIIHQDPKELYDIA